MVIKIIAIILGILIAIAGLVFLNQQKDDPESRKIYTITTIIGVAIAIIFALMLFL